MQGMRLVVERIDGQYKGYQVVLTETHGRKTIRFVLEMFVIAGQVGDVLAMRLAEKHDQADNYARELAELLSLDWTGCDA